MYSKKSWNSITNILSLKKADTDKLTQINIDANNKKERKNNIKLKYPVDIPDEIIVDRNIHYNFKNYLNDPLNTFDYFIKYIIETKNINSNNIQICDYIINIYNNYNLQRDDNIYFNYTNPIIDYTDPIIDTIYAKMPPLMWKNINLNIPKIIDNDILYKLFNDLINERYNDFNTLIIEYYAPTIKNAEIYFTGDKKTLNYKSFESKMKNYNVSEYITKKIPSSSQQSLYKKFTLIYGEYIPKTNKTLNKTTNENPPPENPSIQYQSIDAVIQHNKKILLTYIDFNNKKTYITVYGTYIYCSILIFYDILYNYFNTTLDGAVTYDANKAYHNIIDKQLKSVIMLKKILLNNFNDYFMPYVKNQNYGMMIKSGYYIPDGQLLLQDPKTYISITDKYKGTNPNNIEITENFFKMNHYRVTDVYDNSILEMGTFDIPFEKNREILIGYKKIYENLKVIYNNNIILTNYIYTLLQKNMHINVILKLKEKILQVISQNPNKNEMSNRIIERYCNGYNIIKEHQLILLSIDKSNYDGIMYNKFKSFLIYNYNEVYYHLCSLYVDKNKTDILIKMGKCKTDVELLLSTLIKQKNNKQNKPQQTPQPQQSIQNNPSVQQVPQQLLPPQPSQPNIQKNVKKIITFNGKVKNNTNQIVNADERILSYDFWEKLIAYVKYSKILLPYSIDNITGIHSIQYIDIIATMINKDKNPKLITYKQNKNNKNNNLYIYTYTKGGNEYRILTKPTYTSLLNSTNKRKDLINIILYNYLDNTTIIKDIKPTGKILSLLMFKNIISSLLLLMSKKFK